MTPRIVTITLNPALDLTAETPEVEPGRKLRLGPVRSEPGGGGINVARAVAALGGEALAMACLSGATGQRLAELLEGIEGFTLQPLPAPGDTRESLSVTDTATGLQYRFVLPGPVWEAEAEHVLLDRIAEGAEGAEWVVLSGSQPPGLGVDFPVRLGQRLEGVKFVVDTSGPALQRLMAAPQDGGAPYLLRMNQPESEELAGRRMTSVSESLDFAESLVKKGAAQVAIMARGSEGSVLAGRGLRLFCKAPEVPVVSKVGAGDSFIAAFTLSLARGRGLEAALRMGTAAASSAVMTPAVELCRRDETEALVARCAIFAG